jgi:hypothetical protein
MNGNLRIAQQNMTFTEVLYFFLGLFLGGLGLWLWQQTWGTFQKARSTRQAREKAMSERAKQKEKAREEAVKGWRLFLRSLLFLVLMLALVAVIFGLITFLTLG